MVFVIQLMLNLNKLSILKQPESNPSESNVLIDSH